MTEVCQRLDGIPLALVAAISPQCWRPCSANLPGARVLPVATTDPPPLPDPTPELENGHTPPQHVQTKFPYATCQIRYVVIRTRIEARNP